MAQTSQAATMQPAASVAAAASQAGSQVEREAAAEEEEPTAAQAGCAQSARLESKRRPTRGRVVSYRSMVGKPEVPACHFPRAVSYVS